MPVTAYRYSMTHTLGATIRAWRKDKGLTQEQLATQVRVSQTTITDWERDVARPGSESLIALADVMSMHPRDLIAIPSEPALRDADELAPVVVEAG